MALNAGLLPKNLSALVEQRARTCEPDIYRTSNDIYAGRANRIAVKHHLGRTVAIIEIMSPGNKDSRAALRDFVDKSIDFLRAGVHVLIVDLFPPSKRDPLGIRKLLWDEIVDQPFAFPSGKDRVLASYDASPEKFAYVEPVGVGDSLPEMPLFLAEGNHIEVPLELTYGQAWLACPEVLREAVETGELPEEDPDE